MSPKVCCVILTWNDIENLLECLESISRLTYPNLEIIVSDNGSTDGTAERLKQDFPKVTVLENKRNLFWAGGNNVGIEYALSRNADYIFLLNNDIIIDPELVSELVKIGESDPNIGMLGPKIYYYDHDQTQERRIWYASARISLWRGTAAHIGIRAIDKGQYDEIRPTDYVTGCALMVKRKVIEDIGLIDPSYIAYGEDMDLCFRARKAGYKLMYVPTAVLWHKIGAYWGVVTKRKIKQKLRSQMIFFWRYSPKFAWITTIPVFFVLDVLRVLFLIMSRKIRGNPRKPINQESQRTS
jgi:GT2 family glycosyltransferase